MLTSILCMLMISSIPFPKFPLINFHSERKFSFVALIHIIITFFTFRGYILLPINILYIGSSIINWLQRNNKRELQTNSNPST